MKNKIFTITFLGLFAGFSALSNAQEAILTSGGDATGAGGSSSYSIGQVAYTFADNTTEGSVLQGVQQPFEISQTLSVEEVNALLNMMVFPNPTSDFINLKINNATTALWYQLFDTNGKLLVPKKQVDSSTRIDLSRFEDAVYLLKLIQENGKSKIFKIIKTQ